VDPGAYSLPLITANGPANCAAGVAAVDMFGKSTAAFDHSRPVDDTDHSTLCPGVSSSTGAFFQLTITVLLNKVVITAWLSTATYTHASTHTVCQ
jgi:hypothetical protein